MEMLMIHGGGAVHKTTPSIIEIIFHYINANQVSADTILPLRFK